jgi:2-polyprenyl-3-methyl-5-hydroxy-6-metoxy-1,4-benzoquinol methylase
MESVVNRYWLWVDMQLITSRTLFASRIVERYGTGNSILDVGCAFGYITGRMISMKPSLLVGGDIDSNSIKYAHRQLKGQGVHFVIFDAQNIPFTNCAFDIIIAFEIIEHLPDHVKFIEECYRVLKKGGLLICSTPNRELFSPGTKPWYPGHVHEFTPEELKVILDKYFERTELWGICKKSPVPQMIGKVINSPKPFLLRAILRNAVVYRLLVILSNIFLRGSLKRFRIGARPIDTCALDGEYLPYPSSNRKFSPYDILSVSYKGM